MNVYINLPVENLGRSRAFFEVLGFSFDDPDGPDGFHLGALLDEPDPDGSRLITRADVKLGEMT